MINVSEIQENKINLLRTWRDRYSPSEYPYKVVMNMFYELFADELIWNDIDNAFNRREKIFSSYDQALEHIYMMKRDVQINSVRPNLETSLMPKNKIAAGARFSDFDDNISLAKEGDNEAIVEIEYSYWYFCQYHDVFLHWAACAFLGMDKHEAFIEATGGDLGDLNLSSLEGAIGSFSMILGGGFGGGGWQDYEGNSVNPLQNPNIKYYPTSFQILPPLFESNYSSSNTNESSSNTGCLLIFVPFIIFYFLL